MFGKKENPKQKMEINAEINSMPADFYGGINPVVKFKNVEKELSSGGKEIGRERLSINDKKLLDKSMVVGGDRKFHPANLFTNTKFLLLIGGILFVVFVGGATWYYWREINVTNNTNISLNPPEIIQPIAENQTPVEEATTTLAEVVTEQVVTTTPVSQPTGIDFPPILITDSVDTDRDGLTDMAEEIFGTDPTIIDTDGDGYDDSHELLNLYSPIGKSPSKVADTDLVVDFSNPVYEYKMYYPRNWSSGSVDANYQDVLFSVLNGENIEVRVFDLNPGENFASWFVVNAPTEKYNDLVQFKSKFNEVGLKRSDDLVYYFTDGKRVYVFAYHPNDFSTVIAYRSVLKLMARSFRLPNNSSVVPEQFNLTTETPAVLTVTSTGLLPNATSSL